ncbi:hypothetical protein ACVU7I_16225 [Patulibacter sp. S7RM1-6]
MTAPRLTTVVDFPEGHPGRALLTGRVPRFAAQADQRCSYALHVPPSYEHDGEPYRLMVFVHGTLRRVDHYLDRFAALADAHRAIVMAPLFPAGIGDPNDVHDYKFLLHRGTRFDELLLAMIDEVGQRWNVATERMLLHGFSGGGQFAHRFLFLHPDRLDAVSVGAPGRVTLPSSADGWWRGLADVRERLGVDVDPAAVSRVPTQLVIGGDDDDPGDLRGVPESDGGATRMERLRALHADLRGWGCDVRFDVVPGVAHDGDGVLQAVHAFFADRLGQGRARAR